MEGECVEYTLCCVNTHREVVLMSTHLIKENRSLLLEEDFFVNASLVRRVLQLHSVLSCWFVLVGLLDTATGCVCLRCLPCASLVRLALLMLSCNVLALGRRSVSQPVLAALGLFVVGDSAPSELGCRMLLSVLLLCAVRVARQRRCTALISAPHPFPLLLRGHFHVLGHLGEAR